MQHIPLLVVGGGIGGTAAGPVRHPAEQVGDIDDAFAGYRAERIPRTALVRHVARGWGQARHDDGEVVPALRDRVFARRATDDHTDPDRLYRPVASGTEQA
ncbi:hypothetical protein [Embleya sp. NPDC050493]|uniref:hypothetical protein n=1 Tax=Embleya sp. NPDC050493 TaxID=3363989 RepID=UPI00379F7AB7